MTPGRNADQAAAMMGTDGKIQIFSLEYFMTDRCNLRCAHCTANSPYLTGFERPDLEEFERSLSHLSKVLRAYQIKILGGEPLLNRDICAFMRTARRSGVFQKVRVTTNGILLPRMGPEFWEAADIVEVSLYPGAKNAPGPETLRSLRESARRFRTRLRVHRVKKFFEAFADTRNEDEELVGRIFRECAEARDWSCHLLHRSRLYRCSRGPSLDRYLDAIGTSHEPFTTEDGLRIDGRDTLARDIEAYLSSETPLKACGFCLGTSGASVRCRQLSPGEIRAKRAGKAEPFDETRVGPQRGLRVRDRLGRFLMRRLL